MIQTDDPQDVRSLQYLLAHARDELVSVREDWIDEVSAKDTELQQLELEVDAQRARIRFLTMELTHLGWKEPS